MGQGYSLTTLSAGSAGIDVPELGDLTYEKSLGNARFMKTIRARHRDGLVVAKVVMKPYSSMKLDAYIKILLRERKILTDVPNALAYHRILETSTNGYLVRQYIHSSLYDRMSTRPFLEEIEKKWIAFQLLCVIRDCHARNVYHGDIKTENVLVTSWNWVYLCDFSSSFKPTYLPEDNPADFSFYFDTSGRRTCYLAPERFLGPEDEPSRTGRINWSMDIFSVGCVIAELFLEAPIFSLSQLFKYRQGEYEPGHAHLSKINDKDIRELVSHMIQLDPESRYSAEEYLNFWKRRAFPEYFYGFLHQYMYTITDPSSGRSPLTAGGENLGESDERIDKVYNDFDKISYFLGYGDIVESKKSQEHPSPSGNKPFPLYIDIPNYRHRASAALRRTVDDGTLIFLTLVVSCLRSTARATARLRACELLLAFAERSTDEGKLDRIVPYVVTLLNDKVEVVRVAALRALTQILALVTVVSPINAYIFPEYIFPRLQSFISGGGSKPSPLVRATYASCLATLASTASRFLDMMQALRADGSLPTTDPETEEDSLGQSNYQTLFDFARDDLVGQVEIHTKALLTDTDSAVRRAFLGAVSDLCVFFGSTKANDVILSHLNTYLNDRDWMLKCAFFETIVGVATYVGGPSLEEFILPLMVQALTDPEEFVVEKVIRSFSSMAKLGLFSRSKTWELVDVVGRFTMHPNIWIREAAAQFISSATTFLSVADNHGIVIPLIKPYLKVLPSQLSELKILDSLKKPLPRLVMDMASTWATSADKGIFWKPAQEQRTFSFGPGDGTLPTISARDLGPRALSRTPKNEEDESWLTRLRSAGMSADDEFKLVALREYIWRVAHRKFKDETENSPSRFNTIVSLKDLGITPQTVFFDHKQELIAPRSASNGGPLRGDEDNRPHTITDALLDATTPAEDGLSRRKLSHINSYNERFRRGSNGSGRNSAPKTSPLSSSPNQTESTRLSNPAPSSSQGPVRFSHQPPTSPIEGLIAEHNHAIRHKGSAISLLNRGETANKAAPETGTTSANALGKVDGVGKRDDILKSSRTSALQNAQMAHRRNPTQIRYQTAHSYTGNDPSVLKLLDTVYLENYPSDDIEFGPLYASISNQQPIKSNNPQISPTMWRPEGILIATMGEHRKGINRVLVAPDHTFFITGSDDGTIKIWDTSRLERNIAHRSRLTYKLKEGARVTSLCFIENTHCFISTGSDGSVNVVKVEYSGEAQSGARYGKLKLLREYELPVGEWSVWSEHYKSEEGSILVMATNTSRIVAIDLRTMSKLYELKNPLHHGIPTCFCVARNHDWLLLSTSHGVLDLWDLRFKVRAKAWGFPGSSPIHRVFLHPIEGKSLSPRVCIAGGTGQGEVTVWDLRKLICIEVYRTSRSREKPRGYRLIDIDEERAGGMLGRFGTSVEPEGEASIDNDIRALALGVHVPEDGKDPKSYFLLTAGPDWKVRYWDNAKRFEVAKIISGQRLEDMLPTYGIAQPTPETTIIYEELSHSQHESVASGSSRRRVGETKLPPKKPEERPSRSAIMSQQQQSLLRSHLDTIQDVALLEVPFGMVVSVDRSGVVYVFQ